MNLMPTYVIPDVEYDEEHDDHYTAYNKPFAVAAWLRVRIWPIPFDCAMPPTDLAPLLRPLLLRQFA